ncbi:MAG: DUF6884 domain-containing protein [Pseudonocardiaceae bacterium]
MNSTATASPTWPLAAWHGLIIVGCSRRKLRTRTAVPALQLYQGGCVPQLRERLDQNPALRARIRILSAAHGLLAAHDRVHTYDCRLTTQRRARQLRAVVSSQVDQEVRNSPELAQVLIIAEPLYLVALQRLSHIDRLQLHWIPDPRGWEAGSVVLDGWGWR